jgi:formate/nitrite transporter FocA (FNT family)
MDTGASMIHDFNRVENLIVVYGINFLGAVAIVLLSWWAAGAIERAARRALMSS